MCGSAFSALTPVPCASGNARQNNTPQRWALTSRLSIGAASGLCCLLAVPGYFVFREDTRGNLLNNFAQDDVFANVTRLMYAGLQLWLRPACVCVHASN